MNVVAMLAATGAGAFGGLACADAWMAFDRSARAGNAEHADTPAASARARLTSKPPRDGARERGATPLMVLAAAALGWTVLGVAGALAGAALVPLIARYGVRLHAERLRRERERGAGALARSLADTVRGGHSVRGALHAATTDRAVPDSLRGQLNAADAALHRGTTLVDALGELARAGGSQLVLLCAVLALHAERGGQLPRALDSVADDADRASRLDEERAAATAQARATVRTVAALPLLALAGAQLIGGNLLGSVAQHPVSLALLLLGLLLEAVAVFVAHRLVARAA
jgi:Flp pilus assembly protein TadB